MSYKAKSNNLRIDVVFNWPNIFIEKPLKLSSKFNNTLYINIEKYLVSLLKKTILANNNLETIVNIGNIQTLSYYGGIVIYVNFFFNLKNSSEIQINNLKILLKNAKDYLTRALKIKVNLIFNNFYLFMWKCELYNKCTDKLSLIAIKQAKDANKFYRIESSYFNKIDKIFYGFQKKFKYFSRNRFYNRVSQPFFVLFHYKIIDCNILSNVISVELGLLRRGHKQFLFFIKGLMAHFFSINSNRLKGIGLMVKGRLTLQSRQNRRKQKRIILIGELNTSKRDVYIFEGSNLAYNRFGIINVVFSYGSIKEQNLSYLKKTKTLTPSVNSKNNFKYNKLFITQILNNYDYIITSLVSTEFIKNRLCINKFSIKNYESTYIRELNHTKFSYKRKILKNFLLNLK